MKKIIAAALALIMMLSLAACGAAPADGNASADGNEAKGTVIVGSKGFTENLILSELYALALEDAGYAVERQFEVSNAVINEALVNGEIDIYPEYTGTSLMFILEQPMETDPQVVYDTVKDMYKEKFNLAVLDMCQANDGNGLAISTEAAEKYGIKTISDLQAQASNIRFGSTSDFYEREDGLKGLKEVYGDFNFKEENSFDNALKYQIMESGETDCVPAYTTDAQLAQDFVMLVEDDKNFWPPYNIIPVARQELIDENPEIADIINYVSSFIDTEVMTALNSEVDIDLEEYDDVAAKFFTDVISEASF